MRFYRKTRLDRGHGRIGLHFSRIDVEFLPPDQSGLLTLLHNRLKEAAKDVDPIALTNARETGMVGQGLVQIVANIPPHAEPICCMAHQLPFRADALKEHHQLQFEEHNGVNRRATATSIGLLHELTHERQVKGSLQVSIEVIVRNQLIKGDIDERGKGALLHSHHGSTLSSSSILASSHVCRFLDGSGGRNHSETWDGCIVSCTTACNCSRSWSRSTSWRKVVLKAARVLTASYLRR